MPEINTPLALKAIDSQFGSETVRAYEHAVDAAPHLGGMAFILDEREGDQFHPSELGLPGSYVSLSPNKQHLAQSISSGIVKARMGEFSKFFRERGIQPVAGELVTSILLHELGHADDFNKYILKAGGDTKAAFKLAREVRRSQLATLPLKGPSSSVRSAWNSNTKYREDMKKIGITEASLPGRLLDNSKAYAELPCEKVADRFALGVLATMYSK